MKSTPPMPSVAQVGPLGVVQMPRFWCKVLLEARGQLCEGYNASGRGFDRIMFEGLEIDQDAATAYVRENLPTYPQFEAWILEQAGGSLPLAAAQSVKDTILGYTAPDDRLRAFKESVGLDQNFPTTAYHWLIELDDWYQLHQCLVADGEGGPKRVPFAVEARGPLDVVQLPRLWSKVLLDAKGLLQDGYHPCGNGLDRMVLEGLSLDRDAVVGFLTQNMPSYLEFEQWIVTQRGSVAKEEVEAVNRQILGRESPRRVALLEAAGLDPDLETKAWAVNRYDDWTEFHKIVASI